MSRHVAQIGRRPQLPLLSAGAAFAIPTATTTSRRFLLAGVFASKPASQAGVLPSTARALSSAVPGTQNGALLKNTSLRWPGPAASLAGKVGLERGGRTLFARPARVAFRTADVTRAWIAQRRLFSDQRPKSDGKDVEGTEKAQIEHAASVESARKTEQQITSAAGSRVEQHVTSAAGSKTILDRLPHLHRPSKEELLAAATGFWQRLSIRFKWFSIRSMRPFNMDEIGAFLSWIFWGHVLWIVVGTTTFISAGIWFVNTVFAQETLAGWVGNYLTKSSGIKVLFENAISPKWGVITFQNVFVSRRPGQQAKRERSVSKGSSTTAAAAAAEAALAEKVKESGDSEDDGNYTQFDVTIDTVNVTVSFSKWFNGKGLLKDVEVLGVRGVLDRTNVQSTDEDVDPKSYRHKHHTGDFEIEDFKMSDVLLTVHQPNNFRPFTVSVFNCELPRLRKQWLFYDFMAANNMSGSFDDSLFTVHPRQVHGHTGAEIANGVDFGNESQWKKHSRLRIDGLKIDHLNRGVDGPFSWIVQGDVDIVADVMIPNDDESIWRQSWKKSTEAMTEFIERMEATVTNSHHAPAKDHATTISNSPDTYDAAHGHGANSAEQQDESDSDKRFLILDVRVHLNDARASVPLFTKDLSYVNNALVRPIVAYINSRRAFIPVNCRVVKRQSEFDGSWTIFDSGLLDDLSKETYEAFSRDIVDTQARKRRIKKVGLWTIQLAAQALFIGLAGQLA